MSAIPAAVPDYSPRRPRSESNPSPSHIEIVATRSQRRARPRLVAAIVTVGGLFLILIAQLLLTIATSEGAYEISSLQSKQAGLALDRQVLAEQMQVMGAPQHLAAEAQSMGMVTNSSSAAFLQLSDGSVHGSATAASASAVLRTAADGGPLIPDSLLAGVPLIAGQDASAASTAAGMPPTPTSAPGAGFTAAPSTTPAATTSPTGAPGAVAPTPAITSATPIGIPAPTTH